MTSEQVEYAAEVISQIEPALIGQEFLEHGERGELLEDQGLAPQQLARVITEAVASRTPELAQEQQA